MRMQNRFECCRCRTGGSIKIARGFDRFRFRRKNRDVFRVCQSRKSESDWSARGVSGSFRGRLNRATTRRRRWKRSRGKAEHNDSMVCPERERLLEYCAETMRTYARASIEWQNLIIQVKTPEY